jgi:CRP-like cAMP-binding protein
MATHSHELDCIRPFLRSNTFLGRLPDVVHDALIRKGQLVSFSKRTFVYRRGEPGNSLLVLIKGLVKLANTSAGGKEVVLHYIGIGDIFGEIAALDGKERAADAIALEASDVFVVSTNDLLPTLLAHPPAMLEMLQALCEKIRAGADIIEDHTLRLRDRTVRGLLRIAHQHGRKTAAGTSLPLMISQDELGKYVGTSRPNINRQLAQLKIANMISISGTEITIVDEKGLASLCD